MKAETIWIDIDDTIARSLPVMLGHGIEFCKKRGLSIQLDYSVKTEDDLYFADILHLEDKLLLEFFNEFYPNYLSEIQLIPEAKAFICLMKALGYEVNLISARRDNEKGEVEQKTREWLKNNGIPYDNLIVNCKNKGTYLSGKRGVFIDDCYQNCNSVKDNNTFLFVIQMDTPFSKRAAGVSHADNWLEVFEYIIDWDRKTDGTNGDLLLESIKKPKEQ